MKTIRLFFMFFIVTMGVFSQNGWTNISPDVLSYTGWNEFGELHCINKDTIFAVFDNGNFFKTHNGGTNWSVHQTGYANTEYFDMHFTNYYNGVCITADGHVLKTNDAGNTWTNIPTGTSNSLHAVYMKNIDDFWVVGDTATVLHTTNGGTSWNRINLNRNNNIYDINFTDNSNGYMVGSNGLLLKSTDGGLTWQSINLLTTDDFYELNIDGNTIRFLSGTHNNINIYTQSIYQSQDGIQWNNSSFHSSGAIDFYNNMGFSIETACTTCGNEFLAIYKKPDNSNTWQDSLNYDSGAGHSSCNNSNDIKIVNNLIIYVLSGTKILKTTDGGQFVSIKKHENNLLQIYPNPCKDFLQINTKKSFNTIQIINLTGQIIFEIDNPFETKNLNIQTNNLSKGTYSLKVIGKNFIAVKKIIIE